MNLHPNHYQELHEGSGIAPHVIEARGVFTATKRDELLALGFAEYQALAPAMVLPIRSLNGYDQTYAIKPDRPRLEVKPDGRAKPIKYEYPAGSPNRIDCPPACRADVDNPDVPLLITEGIKKADAAVSNGLCCVALAGVWNFVGKHDSPYSALLPDWGHIPLRARKVGIVYDSDAASNSSVRLARERLGYILRGLGAHVYYIDLPAGADGSKQGLDDYLLHNPAVSVWELAYEPESAEIARLRAQLRQRDEQIRRLQSTQRGAVRVATNKAARKYAPVAYRLAAMLDNLKDEGAAPTEHGDYHISLSQLRGVQYDADGCPRTDVPTAFSEGTGREHLEELAQLVPGLRVEKRQGTVQISRRDRNTGQMVKREVVSPLTYVTWDGTGADLLNSIAEITSDKPEQRGGHRCPKCGSNKIKAVRWVCDSCEETFTQPAREIVPEVAQHEEPEPEQTDSADRWAGLYERAAASTPRREEPPSKFEGDSTDASSSPTLPIPAKFEGDAQDAPQEGPTEGPHPKFEGDTAEPPQQQGPPLTAFTRATLRAVAAADRRGTPATMPDLVQAVKGDGASVGNTVKWLMSRGLAVHTGGGYRLTDAGRAALGAAT